MARLARAFSNIDLWHHYFQKLAFWSPRHLLHWRGLIWLYIHHKNQRFTVIAFFIMIFFSACTEKLAASVYGKLSCIELTSELVLYHCDTYHSQ